MILVIRECHIHHIHNTLIPNINSQTCPNLVPLLVLVACSLATVVCDAVAVAVQLDPHAYPIGQHPPPAVSAQANQPLAHFPVLLELPVVTGSTTVTPSDVKVVEDVVGHEVVSQSRPVWQHPP